MNKAKKEKQLRALLQAFENKWVALSPDESEVLASGETMQEAESKIKPANIEKVLFMKVPPADTVFIASLREV